MEGFTRGNKHNKSIWINKSSSENYSTIFCIFNQVFKIYYTIKLSVLCWGFPHEKVMYFAKQIVKQHGQDQGKSWLDSPVVVGQLY